MGCNVAVIFSQMRFNLARNKTISMRFLRNLLFGIFTVSFIYLNVTIYEGNYKRYLYPDNSNPDSQHLYAQSIKCIVNQNTTIPCRRVDNEVYMPFEFLSKYYEAYGKIATVGKNETVFNFDHSYGNVRKPIEDYNPLGVHADDVGYFVEGRAKVIYISGIEGVPLCMSWWNYKGFFFSTNIGQYGLAHYSRGKVEKNRRFVTIESKGASKDKWNIPRGASLEVQKDATVNNDVLVFKAQESIKEPGIQMDLHLPPKPVVLELISKIKFTGQGSLTVVVQTRTGKTYNIHYKTSDELIRPHIENFDVYYGIGKRDTWGVFTRYLDIDLQKAILLHDKVKLGTQRIVESPPMITAVKSFILHGSGSLLNLTLSNTAHMEHFLDTAEWMLKNIDEKGGWPINSTRVLGSAKIKPGWYSSLGQGVGISIMVRAYGVTKEKRFMDAAIKASKLFHVPSSEGGFKAVFLNKYVWYEEYPTVPASFVLNGFITSLFGLYDLAKVAPYPDKLDAQKLYNNGLASLIALLPLFDTGSRTVYDLKHFTMHTEPNIARWDYHNLHVELLWHISTMSKNPIFKKLATRWDGYRIGKKSAHN